jgi:hypothetical protein
MTALDTHFSDNAVNKVQCVINGLSQFVVDCAILVLYISVPKTKIIGKHTTVIFAHQKSSNSKMFCLSKLKVHKSTCDDALQPIIYNFLAFVRM